VEGKAAINKEEKNTREKEEENESQKKPVTQYIDG